MFRSYFVIVAMFLATVPQISMPMSFMQRAWDYVIGKRTQVSTVTKPESITAPSLSTQGSTAIVTDASQSQQAKVSSFKRLSGIPFTQLIKNTQNYFSNKTDNVSIDSDKPQSNISTSSASAPISSLYTIAGASASLKPSAKVADQSFETLVESLIKKAKARIQELDKMALQKELTEKYEEIRKQLQTERQNDHDKMTQNRPLSLTRNERDILNTYYYFLTDELQLIQGIDKIYKSKTRFNISTSSVPRY